MCCQRIVSMLLTTAMFCLFGCNKGGFVLSPTAPKSWHTKMGWKATEYFDDPQVVALCEAIEKNDIQEIDRLIAAGADVNAKGKGNMTPLLWAFPDNQIKRFKHLLKRGANPNVIFESDFGVPSGFHAGDSVTHMSAGTAFPGYFEAVMEHGGDPELIDEKTGNSLLFEVISSGVGDTKHRVRILIEKGADLNRKSFGGVTPSMAAVTRFAQFDIALLLLKAGADSDVYQDRSNQQLIHHVDRIEEKLKLLSPEQRKSYRELVKWMKEHGKDFAKARRDRERWREWGSGSIADYRKKIDQEIAERIAKEKADAENDAD
ncbi:ankyrin repeat domain-containing protein [Fuerstiella marisgermanici]|uniref:Ankyrin repeat protein n=1 Tax=Fuerstiella marisgermanici TaxID=1891926 RepID=A0A1P8WS04_9PLAN|nr:hypothetical protein [Fuerstiella marisgermanici]APZ96835.1 ankyrin repeat protein [Fuerstiella marisgermanici]